MSSRLLFPCLFFIGALSLPAQFAAPGLLGKQDKKTRISFIHEHTAAAPGSSTSFAIQLSHTPGWHAYHPDHEGPEIRLKIDWELPAGYRLTSLRWPRPRTELKDGKTSRTYEGQYHLLAEISVPGNAPPGSTAALTATVHWQICGASGCEIPKSKDFPLTLPIAATSQADPSQTTLFQKLRAELPAAKPSPSKPGKKAEAPDEKYKLHAQDHLVPTPEDIVAGAKLYDPTKKVPFVTLDGKKETSLTFLRTLPLAFLGGLILNLMPCVFPVLGIKIMGFVQQAGENESKVKLHGLVFGLIQK